jgi:hypothetical protein
MYLKFILFLTACFLLLCCSEKTTDVKGKNLPPYADLLASVEKQRLEFQKAYTTSGEDARRTIEEKAQSYLLEKITGDFFDQWYGTAWDFNGTTRIPRQGKIACGYFITTVLSDAGFQIPRVKWAQQASEYYITRMTPEVKRFSNKSAGYMVDYFLGQADGLYIVGLDNHVGFVFKSGDEVTFTHASYYQPETGVQTEQLTGNNPFSKSAYRVVGRILNQEMIRKWILGESWEH